MLEHSFVIEIGEFITETLNEIDYNKFPKEYNEQVVDFEQFVMHLYKFGLIDILQYDTLRKKIIKHTTNE